MLIVFNNNVAQIGLIIAYVKYTYLIKGVCNVINGFF
jgi:hypothetical protein